MLTAWTNRNPSWTTRKKLTSTTTGMCDDVRWRGSQGPGRLLLPHPSVMKQNGREQRSIPLLLLLLFATFAYRVSLSVWVVCATTANALLIKRNCVRDSERRCENATTGQKGLPILYKCLADDLKKREFPTKPPSIKYKWKMTSSCLNSAAKALAHRQLQPNEYLYLRLDNIPDILYSNLCCPSLLPSSSSWCSSSRFLFSLQTKRLTREKKKFRCHSPTT